MQRRLTIALVGLALASVVLVGAGVLLLAQIGARADTEAEVREQLDALVVDTSGQGPQQLERTRQAFGFSDLSGVVVTPTGEVRILELPARGGRIGGRANQNTRPVAGPAVFVLAPEDLIAFLDGETVIAPRQPGDRSTVTGLQRLDGGLGQSEAVLGLMVRREVEGVPRRAQLWFLVSAPFVLAIGVAVATQLSRRLARPIKKIEETTASIAAGDLTARVEVEGDDEVAQLATSVNRMAGDLQRSKALDQQFLMSVSHDLRTPLTAISGYAEALVDGAIDDPRRAGEIIQTQAARLDRLVGDLLDLAKLDANRFRLNLSTVDLSVVVGRVVAGMAPTAAGYDLELRLTSNQSVVARVDSDRLAQVVGNLIDNALKFAASTVEVTVDNTDNAAVISISDDGTGIASDDLPFIFDRLYTGSSQPVRAENPSGMGLAIVRELMVAMGGTASAHPGPNGGTTMVVTLPVSSEQEIPDSSER